MLLSQRCESNNVQSDADIILINGRVYTMQWEKSDSDGNISDQAPYENTWFPDASAVVISGNKITFVGSTSDAISKKNDESQIIDLARAVVVPGLVDFHTHVLGVGAAIERVDLVGVDTEEEMLERVLSRATVTPKGEWIIGRGWDEGVWANRYPDKSLLSKLIPDHPVFLSSLHGFAGLANQKALDAAGITADTQVPVGGEMHLDENGEPNGLFLNRAVTLIRSAIPSPSKEALMQRALKGLNRMASDGYVAIHDAGLDTEMMEALEQLEEDKLLPIRVYAMLSLSCLLYTSPSPRD